MKHQSIRLPLPICRALYAAFPDTSGVKQEKLANILTQQLSIKISPNQFSYFQTPNSLGKQYLAEDIKKINSLTGFQCDAKQNEDILYISKTGSDQIATTGYQVAISYDATQESKINDRISQLEQHLAQYTFILDKAYLSYLDLSLESSPAEMHAVFNKKIVSQKAQWKDPDPRDGLRKPMTIIKGQYQNEEAIMVIPPDNESMKNLKNLPKPKPISVFYATALLFGLKNQLPAEDEKSIISSLRDMKGIGAAFSSTPDLPIAIIYNPSREEEFKNIQLNHMITVSDFFPNTLAKHLSLQEEEKQSSMEIFASNLKKFLPNKLLRVYAKNGEYHIISDADTIKHIKKLNKNVDILLDTQIIWLKVITTELGKKSTTPAEFIRYLTNKKVIPKDLSFAISGNTIALAELYKENIEHYFKTIINEFSIVLNPAYTKAYQKAFAANELQHHAHCILKIEQSDVLFSHDKVAIQNILDQYTLQNKTLSILGKCIIELESARKGTHTSNLTTAAKAAGLDLEEKSNLNIEISFNSITMLELIAERYCIIKEPLFNSLKANDSEIESKVKFVGDMKRYIINKKIAKDLYQKIKNNLPSYLKSDSKEETVLHNPMIHVNRDTVQDASEIQFHPQDWRTVEKVTTIIQLALKNRGIVPFECDEIESAMLVSHGAPLQIQPVKIYEKTSYTLFPVPPSNSDESANSSLSSSASSSSSVSSSFSNTGSL